MALLKSAGVLSTRREGKQIYCSLAMPEVKQACQLIRKVLQNQISESNRLIEKSGTPVNERPKEATVTNRRMNI